VGIVDPGEGHGVTLSDGSTLLLDKAGWEHELEVFTKLPPPHGPTPEEAEEVRRATRRLSRYPARSVRVA
jgi:hypothetical protein